MAAEQDSAAEARARPRAIRLAPNLDLREAVNLKAVLLAGLAEPGPAIIEAASVKRVTTAALQVLTAFVIACRSAGRTVTLVQPSKSLATGIATAGLSHLFNGSLPESIPCAS